METTTQDSKKALYKSLVQAINELGNPTSSMDNPYFKSKYVPLADILDIAKPVLKKYSLAVIQTPYVMYETIQKTGKNNQVYSEEIGVVKVTTTLIHETGESLEFPPMIFKAQGNTPQNIGSAITYGRRYSLSSVLGLAGKEDDDDGNVASGNVQGNLNQTQYDGQTHVQTQQMQNKQNNNSKPPKTEHPKAQPNVNTLKVQATVSKKTQGQSGKGTPYIELHLEKDGRFMTAIAKDNRVFEIAKNLEEGSTAVFNILTANEMNFVSGIEQI